MNTGFLGSAVATVLTVYGIETLQNWTVRVFSNAPLQQYLPFTVLKPNTVLYKANIDLSCNSTYRLRY